MAIKGLAAFQQENERRAANSGGDRKKVDYLRLDPNETVLIQFLQEVDEDSEHFDPDHGIGFINKEVQPPGATGYQRRYTCTLDTEGKDYGVEQGWDIKSRFYIQVWYRRRNGDQGLAVIEQGWGPQTIVDYIYEHAAEEGTIRNQWFKYKRKGKKLNTSYSLFPKKQENLEEYLAAQGEEYPELYDWDEDVLVNVPYERQRKFALGKDADVPDEEQPSGTDEDFGDDDWDDDETW